MRQRAGDASQERNDGGNLAGELQHPHRREGADDGRTLPDRALLRFLRRLFDLGEVDVFAREHAAVTRPGRVGRVHPRTRAPNVSEEVVDRLSRATGEVQLQTPQPLEGSYPETKAGCERAGRHERKSIEIRLGGQQARDIVREGRERRQGERREFCAPRDVGEHVANVWDARRHLECEVLQLRVEEEVEMVKPAGRLNAPDECGEVGKNVSARALFIDDGEDRGRDTLGTFVIGKAPDALTILKDLVPVFRGRRFSLCSRRKD
jgi:hypothetical protein